ncbi:MAG: hypothetical protein K5876_02895 [Ruminiclostridium sp.]|nr:hypothetical protein [Ruminiclostridium sp.]
MKKVYRIILIAAAVMTAAAMFSGCRDAKRDSTHAANVTEISDSDRLSMKDYRSKLFDTFKKWSADTKKVTAGLYGSEGERLSFTEVSDAIESARSCLDEFGTFYPPKSLDKEHNEMLLAIDKEYDWLNEAEKANNALAANNTEAFKAATEEAGKYLNETTFPAKLLELVKAINAQYDIDSQSRE